MRRKTTIVLVVGLLMLTLSTGAVFAAKNEK